MKKISRWIVLIGIVVIFGALTAFIMPQNNASSKTSNSAFWTNFHHPDTIEEINARYEQKAPPAPNQNPCLHCHIIGYEDSPFTPLWRWLSFGTVGLIFLFGMTRNLTTWNARQPWQPYHKQMTEMANTTDPLGADMEKPAPKWARNLWYALGVVTLFFVLPQIASGAVNWYHMDPIVFDPEMDTHAQLVLGIKTIHWGLGILLLVIMLGFNLIGSLLKSGERSFWAIMLIVWSVFGTPAIIQLSLGYLNPETIIPSSHLYALHAVLLSALIANVVAIYVIFTHKPSEE